ncbi:uncharacterized protein LOC128998808 [Macrosteles quadrilineatus]|uniref:uncharacterized protein LOC128998808 n=1 Tax=Macrosteles quadrilineatus TaxID=74068 RepID=UPI0023E1839C|nr:uncharacterized protein LOC128998808 [Macrosteles quadrilineatus]
MINYTMAKEEPSVYFAKCKLLKATEIYLQYINGETKENLEKILWEQIYSGWSPSSWISVKLLRNVLQHEFDYSDKVFYLNENLTSSRKEIFFTSVLESLNLPHEALKDLKTIFSKVLFANLVSKGKILPKCSSSLETALLKSLLDKPGETHILLQLISCDHEAFSDVNKAITDSYKTALTQCLNRLSQPEPDTRKNIVNLLYALLLFVKNDKGFEEIGESLYYLCQTKVLDIFSILTISGCQKDISLYNDLRDCENKSMLRYIDCSSGNDKGAYDSVYDKVLNNGQMSFEEMFQRLFSLKCHWVEELVTIATHFVDVKEQRKLEDFISFPALWPAVAISVWKQFSSRQDLVDIVLPVIEFCQEAYPALFSQLQGTVRRMKAMTDWLRSEGVMSLPDVNAMLSLTRNHSTLHVLQSTTHFVGLHHTNLHRLLVQLEGKESWNVRVFEGFTLIFDMIQTITKAVDYFNEAEKDKNKSQFINLKYKEDISNTIVNIGDKINQIEPLNFRLELLEDIFLLLFIRSEDYCEIKGMDDGSSDENDDIFTPKIRCSLDIPDNKLVVERRSMPTSPSHRRQSPSRASTTSSSQRKTSVHSKKSSKPFRSKYSRGFVCFPWLVSDILSCVKRSLEYVETTCDISGCDRYIRLKKSVEDASWKFNLVRAKGCKDLVSLNKSKTEEQWVYVEDDSSDSDTSPPPVPLPSSSTRRSRRGGSTSRSESGSNATGLRLSSSTSSIRSKKCSALFSTSSDIINLMLAPPDSLVAYFIIKENLEKASKCVEKFSMQNQPMDIELNFLKEFSSLRKQLAELQVKPLSSSSSVKDIALQVISETASSGVLTATLTKLFETFFATTSLPIEVGDSKGVVVLDIAVSHLAPPQHSSSLLDLSSYYLTLLYICVSEVGDSKGVVVLDIAVSHPAPPQHSTKVGDSKGVVVLDIAVSHLAPPQHSSKVGDSKGVVVLDIAVSHLAPPQHSSKVGDSKGVVVLDIAVSHLAPPQHSSKVGDSKGVVVLDIAVSHLAPPQHSSKVGDSKGVVVLDIAVSHLAPPQHSSKVGDSKGVVVLDIAVSHLAPPQHSSKVGDSKGVVVLDIAVSHLAPPQHSSKVGDSKGVVVLDIAVSHPAPPQHSSKVGDSKGVVVLDIAVSHLAPPQHSSKVGDSKGVVMLDIAVSHLAPPQHSSKVGDSKGVVMLDIAVSHPAPPQHSSKVGDSKGVVVLDIAVSHLAPPQHSSKLGDSKGVVMLDIAVSHPAPPQHSSKVGDSKGVVVLDIAVSHLAPPQHSSKVGDSKGVVMLDIAVSHPAPPQHSSKVGDSKGVVVLDIAVSHLAPPQHSSKVGDSKGVVVLDIAVSHLAPPQHSSKVGDSKGVVVLDIAVSHPAPPQHSSKVGDSKGVVVLDIAVSHPAPPQHSSKVGDSKGVVVLDIAVSHPAPPQHSSKVGDSKGVVVLDIAVSHPAPPQHSSSLLDLASNYFCSSISSHISGTLKAFTASLRSLLMESENSATLSQLLLDPSIALRRVWVSVQQGLDSLETALASEDDNLADAAYLKLAVAAISAQDKVQNYQDNSKHHFLNQLRFYLTCLWKVVSPSLLKGTKYHILEHNLDGLIGMLVFSKAKDPMDIEATLRPLSINVVHLVVACCTPSISFTEHITTPDTIVLNGHLCAAVEEEDSVCQPDLVAYLLGALLDSVSDSPNTPNVDAHGVLESTSRLRSLDWRLEVTLSCVLQAAVEEEDSVCQPYLVAYLLGALLDIVSDSPNTPNVDAHGVLESTSRLRSLDWRLL